MTKDEHFHAAAYEHALRYLAAAQRVDKLATDLAVEAYVEDCMAGLPVSSAVTDDLRSDARFWGELATPAELEAYLLVAADKIAEQGGNFHRKQLRRLFAAIWLRLLREERMNFLKWAGATARTQERAE